MKFIKIITLTTVITSSSIYAIENPDIKREIKQSIPTDINIPVGLDDKFDIKYLGAFRANAGGDSSSDYAVGALGFNSERNSLFLAGHAHHNALAEFEIPSEFSFEENASSIIRANILQDYETILDKKDIGNNTNKITGVLSYNGNLIVNSEIWYDGSGRNTDNMQVFSNSYDIESSPYKGMLQLEGKAHSAGYMSKIPEQWQERLGGEYLTGWADNYSIVSRYSVGPSLFVFDPQDAIDSVLEFDRAIPTKRIMSFPYGSGTMIVDGANKAKLDISPIWGPSTSAKFAFIVPNSDYFVAVGRHSGIHSGIGYKITQDTGRLCGGYCTYEADDVYNYYWVFNINDMLEAENSWDVEPVAYGKWSHPYDKSGAHGVIGGTFDDQNNILYLSLGGAGRAGEYDRPPLILAYEVNGINDKEPTIDDKIALKKAEIKELKETKINPLLDRIKSLRSEVLIPLIFEMREIRNKTREIRNKMRHTRDAKEIVKLKEQMSILKKRKFKIYSDFFSYFIEMRTIYFELREFKEELKILESELRDLYIIKEG